MRRIKPGHVKSLTLFIAGGTKGGMKAIAITGILQ